MIVNFFRFFLFFFIALNLFISCLFVAWQINSKADYFYAPLYEPLEIEAHIKRLAPLNTDKTGYADVGEEEHKRVFSEIVASIHKHGIGLEDIRYYGLDGEPINTLFNEVEALHMYEVAAIMTKFFMLGLVSMFVSILVVLITLKRKLRWPPRRLMLGSMSLVLAVFILAFIVLGFDSLFVLMHELLFKDAPWIFSYSESLLVVLTKSPQYFAVLGLTILVPALMLYVCALWLLSAFNSIYSKGS